MDTEEGRVYTPVYDYRNLVCFNGWRPYSQSVDAFTDKLKFKELMVARGLRSPEYKDVNDRDFESVIVKRRVSSFSEAITGPYKNAGNYQLQADMGEYFEKYIEGEVFKIWFVDDCPVALEKIHAALCSRKWCDSIEVLMESCFDHHNQKISLTSIERKNVKILLNFYGRKITDVLPVGEKQIIDFKYVNRYRAIEDVKINGNFSGRRYSQLKHIGDVIWSLAKPEAEKNFSYTVDAIFDKGSLLDFRG